MPTGWATGFWFTVRKGIFPLVTEKHAFFRLIFSSLMRNRNLIHLEWCGGRKLKLLEYQFNSLRPVQKLIIRCNLPLVHHAFSRHRSYWIKIARFEVLSLHRMTAYILCYTATATSIGNNNNNNNNFSWNIFWRCLRMIFSCGTTVLLEPRPAH